MFLCKLRGLLGCVCVFARVKLYPKIQSCAGSGRLFPFPAPHLALCARRCGPDDRHIDAGRREHCERREGARSTPWALRSTTYTDSHGKRGQRTQGEKEKEEIKGKSQNQKKQDKKLKRLEENKLYKIRLETKPRDKPNAGQEITVQSVVVINPRQRCDQYLCLRKKQVVHSKGNCNQIQGMHREKEAESQASRAVDRNRQQRKTCTQKACKDIEVNR